MELACPHCAGAIEATPTDQPQVATCPHCAHPLILPAADGSTIPIARPPGSPSTETFITDDTAPPHHDDELDGLRIRQIAKMRRAAIRARSWFLIGTVFCAVAAGHLLLRAFLHWRANGPSRLPLAFIFGAIACAALAYRCSRRADHFRREAIASSLAPPEAPPDFSPLRDGSQHWKNLEDL